jgi:Skp family chaperone for outer membrane proteins
MKNFKTIIVTLLLLTVALSGVFAQGSKESAEAATVSKKVELSSVDLSTASLQTIKDAYQSELDNYKTKYENIYNKMVESYKEGNVDDYFDAKGMLRNLTYPEITAEQTEVLVNRIKNEKDEAAKAELSLWLYENSRYYHPALHFTTSRGSEEQGSFFSYQFEISSEPGSKVTVPHMRTHSAENGIFAGWGTEDGKVLYEAGEEITMPYEDQTLYAVYKTGALFIDHVAGTRTMQDGPTVTVPASAAPDDSYVFLGWFDAEGNKAEGTVTLEDGQSKVFSAAYRSILIEDVRARHTKDGVPADKKVELAFCLYNQGSSNTGRLTVNLVCENDALKNLSGELHTRGISAGEEKSGSFTIVATGNSGDVINASIVVTDEAGNTWKAPVTLTVK